MTKPTENIAGWKHQTALRRAARKAAGLCTKCDAPRAPGLKVCARHHAMAANSEQARKGRDNARRDLPNGMARETPVRAMPTPSSTVCPVRSSWNIGA